MGVTLSLLLPITTLAGLGVVCTRATPSSGHPPWTSDKSPFGMSCRAHMLGRQQLERAQAALLALQPGGAALAELGRAPSCDNGEPRPAALPADAAAAPPRGAAAEEELAGALPGASQGRHAPDTGREAGFVKAAAGESAPAAAGCDAAAAAPVQPAEVLPHERAAAHYPASCSGAGSSSCSASSGSSISGLDWGDTLAAWAPPKQHAAQQRKAAPAKSLSAPARPAQQPSHAGTSYVAQPGPAQPAAAAASTPAPVAAPAGRPAAVGPGPPVAAAPAARPMEGTAAVAMTAAAAKAGVAAAAAVHQPSSPTSSSASSGGSALGLQWGDTLAAWLPQLPQAQPARLSAAPLAAAAAGSVKGGLPGSSGIAGASEAAARVPAGCPSTSAAQATSGIGVSTEALKCGADVHGGAAPCPQASLRPAMGDSSGSAGAADGSAAGAADGSAGVADGSAAGAAAVADGSAGAAAEDGAAAGARDHQPPLAAPACEGDESMDGSEDEEGSMLSMEWGDTLKCWAANVRVQVQGVMQALERSKPSRGGTGAGPGVAAGRAPAPAAAAAAAATAQHSPAGTAVCVAAASAPAVADAQAGTEAHGAGRPATPPPGLQQLPRASPAAAAAVRAAGAAPAAPLRAGDSGLEHGGQPASPARALAAEQEGALKACQQERPGSCPGSPSLFAGTDALEAVAAWLSNTGPALPAEELGSRAAAAAAGGLLDASHPQQQPADACGSSPVMEGNQQQQEEVVVEEASAPVPPPPPGTAFFCSLCQVRGCGRSMPGLGRRCAWCSAWTHTRACTCRIATLFQGAQEMKWEQVEHRLSMVHWHLSRCAMSATLLLPLHHHTSSSLPRAGGSVQPGQHAGALGQQAPHPAAGAAGTAAQDLHRPSG